MSTLMKCCVCGAEQRSDADGCTDWRVMEVAGRRFYFCPKETPRPGASAEEFAAAKARCQAKVLELIENEPPPRCQVCGCTEDKPCLDGGDPCSWIAPGVLCSACLPRIPIPRTPDELAKVIAPMLPQTIEFEIPAMLGFQLLSVLQLALRHPHFPPELAETMIHFAHELQFRVSSTPELAAVCAAGWDRSADIHERPRIVRPGDRDFCL